MKTRKFPKPTPKFERFKANFIIEIFPQDVLPIATVTANAA